MIRRADPHDAVALAELQARTLWETYGDFVEHEKIAAVLPRLGPGWRERLSPDGLADAEVWVADEHGALAGWISVGSSRDRDARPGDGELRALYVEPPRVGSGLGSELLAHGEARLVALGHDAATLWVLSPNTRARAFYERHGWIADDRIGRNPYDDWSESMRYRKLLTR